MANVNFGSITTSNYKKVLRKLKNNNQISRSEQKYAKSIFKQQAKAEKSGTSNNSQKATDFSQLSKNINNLLQSGMLSTSAPAQSGTVNTLTSVNNAV